MRWLFENARQPTLAVKLLNVNWMLVLLLATIAGIGFAMLYSAANGNWQPWAARQVLRFAVAVVVMLAVALVDIRFWLRSAYVFYAVTMVLLIAVEVRGAIGMGAQRWIDLGLIQLQPSEFMKIALILVLARYFNALPPEDIRRPVKLLVPALFVFVPAILVLKQPDLGTALMLVIGGAAMFFLAGVRLWKFALIIAAAGAVIPFAWTHLRDYQRNRIYTFLDPESDPLGAGYHSLQSKIAVGSGGIFGKGFLSGTQSTCRSCPSGRPTSSSPFWPRNSASSAAWCCWRFTAWCSSTAMPSRFAHGATSAGFWPSASLPTCSSMSSSTWRWSSGSSRWSACRCRSSPMAAPRC